MKLRLLSLLLALTLVLSLLPVGVAAIEYESFEFDPTSGTITEYKLNISTPVTIPSEIPVGDNKVPVRAIGKDAFSKCTSMTAVTIPNTVETIGEQAFQNCSALTSVTIQGGGKALTIGKRAFSGCGFSSIILPDSLEKIEENAFANCKLASILIPKSVKTIENFAFYSCKNLTTVSLPADVSLGSQVFTGAGTTIIHYCGDVGDSVATALIGEGFTIHPSLTNTPASTTATCTTGGTVTEDIFCRGECKKVVLSVIRETPPLPHDLDVIPAVPPTCTEAGKEEGSVCKNCKNIVVVPMPIPATGHDWKDDTSKNPVEVPATCQKTGTLTTEQICGNGCGETYTKVETLEKKNHEYTNGNFQEKGIELIAATCKEPGEELNVRLCDFCNQPEVIDSKHLKEHEEHLNDEPPWTCGENHTTKVIPAIEHKDGKSDEFKVVSGQDYICTEGGEVDVIYKCKFCGEFIEDNDDFKGKETLKPGQHAFGEPEKIEDKSKDPTCTEDGLLVTKRVCTKCGFEEEEEEEVVSATGHNVKKWEEVDKATCTKVGHRSGKCSNKNCPEKDSIVIEEIKALGHDWESDKVKKETIKEATCTEKGSEYWICGREDCDGIENKKTVEIEMLPHSPKAPEKGKLVKAATCTEEGSMVYDTVCKNCGTNLQNTPIPIPALGHDFGPWTTSGSTRTRTCKREGCGYKETDASSTPSNPSEPSNPSNPGSSSNTYYSVDVIRPANGSISVSTSSARADTRVTVTLRPNSGYQLDSVWVTRSGSGRNVALSGNGTNRYTFIMPAARVEVRAAFSSISGTSTNTTTPPNDRNTNPTKNVVVNIPQISSASTPAGSRVFVDVPSSFWAQGEIAWACQKGFISGSGGNFFPNNPITVRQLWMVMARMMGKNPANMEEARLWALNNGFADGGNPNAALTRLQLATMLYRCARLMGSKNTNTTNLGNFTDSRNIPASAKNAMAWAVANGIITGTTDGRLNPSGTVSRAQFCVILYRYYQRLF